MTKYVQFGGFTDCPVGWRNFEPSVYLRLSRVPLIGSLVARWLPHQFPRGVEVGDIVKGLPIKDSEVDVVYCSHVLEHLRYEEAIGAVRNVYRILKPGGKFRVVVPDLEGRAKFYLENMADLDAPANWFMRATLLGQKERRQSPLVACAKILFSSSEHRWMWDYQTMAHELHANGFKSVRRFCFGESQDPVILAAEKESRFFWSPGEALGVAQNVPGERYPELAIEATK